MPETNESALTSLPLRKLVGKYSIPCVLSLLVGALYNIVDQLFIANAAYLGSYGNAANSVVFPLTMVTLALATMLGDGCCAFTSLSLGAKKEKDAHRSNGTIIITIILTGVFLMAIYFIFQDQILTMFGGRINDETFAMAKEYFFWITVGVPFYMFGQALNPIIRSDGSPRFAMVTLTIGSLINVVLDPIFIFIFHWGMMGAAVATILGQIFSAILAGWYLFHMKQIKLSKDSFKFRPVYLSKCIPLGMTSFMSQISVVFSMAAVLNMARIYGAQSPVFGQEQYAQIPTAVIGIVMKFFQIIISIAVGISAGCIPVTGFNMGAGRYDRVRGVLRLILKAEIAVGLIATIVFEVFPYQWTMLFSNSSESTYYTEFAVLCIRVFLSLLIISCVNKGAFIFLQSLGKAGESTLLSVLREIILGVGLPILLPIFFGLNGLVFFMPVADVLTLIPTIILLVREDKNLVAMMKFDASKKAP